jgi:nucleoid DNA-binding protein
MRTSVEWRSASKDNYNDFCRKHPLMSFTYDQWRNIIYSFNELFKEHILETGEKIKLPFGLGEFSINKKKRKKIKVIDGQEFINLPIDWAKTKKSKKIIYNFNFHTEGFFFGWMWFRESSRFKHSFLWNFKPCRVTSRLLCHYLKSDDKYQHIYQQWSNSWAKKY